MRISKFNKNTKPFLTRVLLQYEQGKLTPDEEIRFFQDLADSGFGWQLGNDYRDLVNSLIATKVIKPPPSGFTPEMPKFSEMIKVKKVLLN